MQNGFTTSSFIMAAVSSIVGMLVMAGKLSSDEADQLTKAIQTAAGAVVTIASIIGYLVTRLQLKQAVVTAVAQASVTPDVLNIPALDQPTSASGRTGTAVDTLHAALTKAGV